MKNFLVGGLAVAALSLSGVSHALSITCDEPTDSRKATLDYVSGTITCGPSGDTNVQPEGDFFAPPTYTFLEKDDGAGDINNGGLMNLTGLASDSGTISFAANLFSDYSNLILVFKFGAGQATPDWISFNIANVVCPPVVAGVGGCAWSVIPNQALSHATLYGVRAPQVPEPATLALMGLGLAGLGFASRRRRKA